MRRKGIHHKLVSGLMVLTLTVSSTGITQLAVKADENNPVVEDAVNPVQDDTNKEEITVDSGQDGSENAETTVDLGQDDTKNEESAEDTKKDETPEDVPATTEAEEPATTEAETTTPGVVEVEPADPVDAKAENIKAELINFITTIAVKGDKTDLQGFKSLVVAQEIEGESLIPFDYMNNNEFEEWTNFKGTVLVPLLESLKNQALEDDVFGKEYIDYVTTLLEQEYIDQGINTEGATLKSVLLQSILSIYEKQAEGIDMSETNFLHYDLAELILLDDLSKLAEVQESPHFAKSFLDHASSIIDEFLSDEWATLHLASLYKEAIYKIAAIDQKEIKNTELLNQLNGLISKVTQDMKIQNIGVASRFDIYATLNGKKLTGELLNVYREIIDQKRGMVGWYYTGVNSEDYDHDADKYDQGSRIFQEDQLIAVKLEERGSDFDIRRSLYGLYNEALDKEQSTPSYYRGIKKVVYKAYLSVPETENYRFNFYLDGKAYEDRDYRIKFTVKDKDEHVISREGNLDWSADLDKNKLYPVEFTIYAQDSDDHLPDHIQLKWSYGDKAEEVIQNRFFFADNRENLTSKESIDIVHLDPIGDADMDGIPNAWEMDGFVVLGNTIRKYNPDIHKGMNVYYTSPVDKSTDGDPYTDLEEVIGANVTGVTDAGHHPLVAAYPEIVAELTSVTVNARMVDKYSNKETESTATLKSTDNTTVNKHTSKTDESKGFTVGVHIDQSAGYAQTPVSGGIKLSGGASISAGGKYEKLTDSEDVTTTIGSTTAATSQDSEVIESLTRTMDSFKSGDLSFGIRLKNIGSASAYDITPNISLYLGSEVGRNNPAFTTVEVPGDFYDLAPGQSSQVLNIETRKIAENSNRQLYLTVNKEIMEKILKGYPVTMQMNNASSKVIVDGNGRGNWDQYVNNISGITATINHQDAVEGLHKYKVFAARKTDNYRPQVTVGQALHNIYGDKFVIEDRTSDGQKNPQAYINDKMISNINIYADDVSQLNEYFNQSKDTTVNIFNLPLRPSMIVDVETSNSTETKPFILNTLYKRDKVSAYVLGNCSDVESVVATVATTGGDKEVTLKQSEENSLLFEYTFEESPTINIQGNSRVTATDKNGNASTVSLYVANGAYLKEQIDKEAYGSRYKALDSDYRITKKEDALKFVKDHPAQAYVVYRKKDVIWSHSRPTKIYSKAEMEDFGDLQYDLGYFGELFIQGYFGEDGDKYRPVTPQDYSVYFKNWQTSRKFNLETGINDATGYVVMFGSSERANEEKGTTLKVNDRTYKYENWSTQIKSNNMFFIKADKDNPSLIKGEVSVPNKGNNKRFDLQVVGYFTKEDGLNYKPLDRPINVKTIASNERSVVTRTIDSSLAVLEPKAYAIQIIGSNVGEQQNSEAVEINGIKYTHSRAENKKGSFKSYIIVPNGNSPRELAIKVLNPSGNRVANYNIEIVGYFY